MNSFHSVASLRGEDDPAAKEPIMEKQPSEDTPQAVGVTPRLLVAIVVVMVGSSIPSGFCLGVLNTPSEILWEWMVSVVHAAYDFELLEHQAAILFSVIVSIFVAGAIVGSSVGAVLADRLGRRRALFLNHCLGLASALFFLACRPAGSVELLILGRILSGVTAGVATSIVPLYLSEIAPTVLAGVMGVLMPLGITFGLLLSQIMGMQNVMGTDTLWPFLLAMNGVMATAALVSHVLLPESPTYLYLIVCDDAKGRKELCKLRGASHPDQVANEERMLKTEAKKALERKEEGWTLMRILRTPELRMPLAVSVILPLGQQFSGINAVFFYSTLVFHSAGLDLHESQMASIGASAINFGLALVSVFLIKVCRRRVLFLTSVALSIVCQVVLVVALRGLQVYAGAAMMAILAILAFVLAYGIGLGPVPYMVGTEVFPPGPRSVGLAMGGMANWVGNLTVGFTFLPIHNFLGEYSFCVFIGFSSLLWLFAFLCLPETLQKKADRHPTDEPDLLGV